MVKNGAILVTGGAGFIGSHLCERLVAQEERVICLDNLFTGSMENIEHLLTLPNFSFVEHDIIEQFFADEPISHIYNLACPASPVHYRQNPVRTIKANTVGMINVLGLARKHGAVFLQTSTSEVYGDPQVHPQTEEYRGNVNPIGPRSCYDEGKRCAETLCFDYFRMHGMPVKIVRIFNTYGPRMAFDDGRVVSNFILQALRNEPITVYGDGRQTRSFCFVDDLVDGLISMMNTPVEIQGPVNLGNPGEFTIMELANKIIEMTGSHSEFSYKALPVDDPKQRQPDITLAKKTLSWEPTIQLEQGLGKTIEEFRARLKV